MTFPNNKVILTSYSDDYANKYGRIAKNIINDYGCYYGVELAKDSSKSSLFNLKNFKGQMLSSGFYGQLTGQGGHLIIVDDPVKNGQEALSETMRNKTYDTFIDTIYTRLEPHGKIIIVMTRWHEDDLAGRLLKNHSDKFEYLKLEAIANDNDVLGRVNGEALWERRINKDMLSNIRNMVGSYYWNALYQQNPTDMDNGFFKLNNINYFRYSDGTIFADNIEKSTMDMFKFFTIDLAISEKTGADNTVISYWNYDGTNVYLIDCFYEQIEPVKHFDKIKYYYELYKPDIICVESTQYQIVLFQELLKYGYPVEKLMPSKNKIIRATSALAYMNNKQIYINKNIEKINELENEILYFPFGKHDDFIDTLSYAVNRVISFNFGDYNENDIYSEVLNDNISKGIETGYGAVQRIADIESKYF
jgi:predicted phage terminase large subunit-like protein